MRLHVASLVLVALGLGLSRGALAQACADDKSQSAKSALESCSLPAAPKTISGRCELVIAGAKPVSCSRIQLLLRSKAEKKATDHAAAIDGFSFKFTDLGQTSYDMILASTEFELKTKSKLKGLKVGQSDLKIRIDAKPVR